MEKKKGLQVNNSAGTKLEVLLLYTPSIPIYNTHLVYSLLNKKNAEKVECKYHTPNPENIILSWSMKSK